MFLLSQIYWRMRFSILALTGDPLKKICMWKKVKVKSLDKKVKITFAIIWWQKEHQNHYHIQVSWLPPGSLQRADLPIRQWACKCLWTGAAVHNFFILLALRLILIIFQRKDVFHVNAYEQVSLCTISIL